jgi:hypothetical protein
MPLSPVCHPPKQPPGFRFVGLFGAVRISLCFVVAYLSMQGIAPAAEEMDSVVERLANVDVFAFGGVGFAGSISPGEKDYRVILAHPAAEADFERLFTVGNLQAKCYALVGLRQVNQEKFKALSTPVRSSKGTVSTMHGCIMRHETIAAVVAAIHAGNYSK